MSLEAQRPAPIGPGILVDHFQVVRLIARGGMGEVYLARDTKLGRKVALKVVRASSLGSSEAVERFLFEARTTARFSHPNIVTVFAVGEHLGSPYVALEYLEGQSLRERLDERRMGLKEILRVGIAVGAALQEAHRHGILHRDLKPDNVLVPQDGRVRVVDFGLAKAFDDESFVSRPGLLVRSGPDSEEAVLEEAVLEEAVLEESGIDFAATQDLEALQHGVTMADATELSTRDGLKGTPHYMAPEQWARAELSTAVDLWAFGLMLLELAAGEHPFRHLPLRALRDRASSAEPTPELDALGRLPPRLGEMVERCLHKDPAARPSASEVTGVLAELLHEAPAGSAGEQSPFRGLLPFTERQAHQFFGRDDEVAQFLERLRHSPVLAVVGPSGAGKSSFVRAGVVPRLMEQERWLVLSLRPGRQPFEALASQLLRSDTGRSMGMTSPPRSTSLAGSLRPPDPAAEERLCAELSDSPPRLALHLHQLAEQHGAPVLLFVDQLEELSTHVEDEATRRRFIEAVSGAADDPDGPVRVIVTLRDDFMGRLAEGQAAREALSRVTVLRSPGPEALTQILTRPVLATGYDYDDPALVEEIVAAVEGEPAALPLVQFVGQLLWNTRDQDDRKLLRAAYDAAGGVEGALAKQADLVLEGLTPEQLMVAREIFLRLVTAEGTRRVVARSNLLDGLSDSASELLDRLVQERALLLRKGASGPEVEIVHESLVHSWQWLERCIAESKEELTFLGELEQAAALWEKRGRRPAELWQDDALREALRTVERSATKIPPACASFLNAGRRRAAQKLWRRRGLLAAVIAALLAVALTFALQNRQLLAQGEELVERRQEAESKRAEALLEGARAALGGGKVLEARAKLRSALEQSDAPLARALWWQLRRDPLVWSRDAGALPYNLHFAPDGSAIAVASQDGSVYLLAVETGRMRVLRGHTDQVMTVAFSPDSQRLASGGWGGEIRLWEVSTGREVGQLRGHSDVVWAVRFSPDGEQLASSGGDKGVRLWDLGSKGKPRVFAGHDASVYALSFTPNGERLASGGVDRTVRIWQVKTGAEQRKLELDAPVYGLSFSADGQRLASASGTQVQIWSASTGRRQRVLSGHSGKIYGLSFSPQGNLLASCSLDNSVRVWNGDSGEELQRFQRGESGLWSVGFSPDGKRLAAVSHDNRVWLWDIGTRHQDRRLSGHADAVNEVRFGPSGRLLVSGGLDATLRVWDLRSGDETQLLLGHDDGVMSVDFSRDGKRVAGAGRDNNLRLWDPDSGKHLRALSGHAAMIEVVRFNHDGSQLASGSTDLTVRLWNVAEGRETHRLPVSGGIIGLAFQPQGTLLATGEANHIQLWGLPSGQRSRTLLGHQAPIAGLAFSPDGSRIASASWDKHVVLWDVASGRETQRFSPNDGRAYGVVFSPEGERIAAAWSDGTGRIWDLDSSAMVELRGHSDEVNAIDFGPEGKRVATASDDGTVRLWDAATGTPTWRAPLLLSHRDGGVGPLLLTHRGWSVLGAADRGAPSSDDGVETQWRRAVEQRARFVSSSAQDDLLCMITHDRAVELWSISSDRRLREPEAETVEAVVAVPQGCLARQIHKGGKAGALLVPRQGAVRALEVEGDVTAVARSQERMLVAAGGKIFTFELAGTPAGRHEAGVGITALNALDPGWLALGYRNGNVELLPTDEATTKPTYSFESVPSSSVTSILAGPMRTLVVGFANGVVGLWNRDDGKQLEHARIHGPVTHLALEGTVLYAVTDLGQHLVWDLSVFSADRCELLQELWQRVPVVWEGGQPVVRTPPSGHACSPR